MTIAEEAKIYGTAMSYKGRSLRTMTKKELLEVIYELTKAYNAEVERLKHDPLLHI